MNGMGGLVELILVFAIVLGWGFVELRAARRFKRKTDETAPAARGEDGSDA